MKNQLKNNIKTKLFRNKINYKVSNSQVVVIVVIAVTAVKNQNLNQKI